MCVFKNNSLAQRLPSRGGNQFKKKKAESTKKEGCKFTIVVVRLRYSEAREVDKEKGLHDSKRNS